MHLLAIITEVIRQVAFLAQRQLVKVSFSLVRWNVRCRKSLDRQKGLHCDARDHDRVTTFEAISAVPPALSQIGGNTGRFSEVDRFRTRACKERLHQWQIVRMLSPEIAKRAVDSPVAISPARIGGGIFEHEHHSRFDALAQLNFVGISTPVCIALYLLSHETIGQDTIC